MSMRSIFPSLIVLSSSLLVVAVSGDLFSGLLPHAIGSDEYNDLKSNRKTLGETKEVKEFTPIFSFLRPEPQGRHLVESCATGDHPDRCAAVLTIGLFNLGDGDANVYTGCGALLNEVDGGFCMDEDTGTTICCGTSSDCCSTNVGAVVGILIAITVAIVASIFGCCYCCKCCCLYDKLHGTPQGNSNEVVITKQAPPSPTKLEDINA